MKKLVVAVSVALCISVIAPKADAQSGWADYTSWDRSVGYKKCNGPLCTVYTEIYTDRYTARVGDILNVYNSKTRKIVERFEIKGIYYQPSNETCWITAKPGQKPDTYLTAIGCSGQE